MKYQLLFSVRVLHEYYQANDHSTFGFKVDASTQQLMKRYGLLFSNSSAGFSIYYSNEKSLALLEKLREEINLTFFMIPEDKLLLNYSSLNTVKENGYWLSNLHVTDSGQLHQEPYVGTADAVEFLSRLNQLDRDGAEKVQVKNAGDDVLFDGTLREFFTANLQNEDLSFFKIVREDGQESKYYLLNANPNQIAGVLTITLDPSSEIVNLERVTGSNYQIKIDARHVRLKYFIVNRNKPSYDHFKLYHNKQLINTTEEKTVTLGGEESYLLKTEEEFALSERYQQQLELEMSQHNGERNGKKRISLPRPEIDKIKVEEIEGEEKAYAEMYVYT